MEQPLLATLLRIASVSREAYPSEVSDSGGFLSCLPAVYM